MSKRTSVVVLIGKEVSTLTSDVEGGGTIVEIDVTHGNEF